ncbi:MAG TPA: phosphate ABC transporter permease PstA [Phycisphaerales bacterium]|nr:phosphate ABC transporter permease PstA [Phycisphaerales bacterium]HMP35923.1 phosphate ABC transporter permease PstA [Phycisphaerales bacterium]
MSPTESSITKSTGPAPSTRRRRRIDGGEPLVFLTGMGLAIGLTMITALLALILFKGLEAFWPKRVARIELTPAAAERVGRDVVVAHILGRQEIRGAAHAEGGAGVDEGDPGTELRLQVGNRDLNGMGFMYLPESAIERISHPRGILRLERMEYGPALVEPLELDIAGEPPLSLASEGGIDALERAIRAAAHRRAEIRAIERDQIGGLSRRIESLRMRRRGIEASATPDPAEVASIEARIAELERRYEGLAAESRALRDAQHADTLTYRIDSGREHRIPVGEIVSAERPNALGFFGRLRVFLGNMWSFVVDEPREANTEGGIFPALFGTFVMTLILSVAVTPFGVIAAIYLREYAKDGPTVRAVRIAINNLAGVPSIVFGVFGLGFFVYFVGGSIDTLFFRLSEGPVFGTGGILWASLTLALMTVPVVIVATEEALAAVSRGVREGSLACGASKWQTIQRIVLPAAAPGIITGMILAMARGAGEVAPLMITGVVKLAPTLPLDATFPFLHLDRKFMHLGFHIYDLGFQSPDSEAARPMVFATTLLLIALVVTMNLGAIVIRERLRRKYATGAF